MFNLIKHKVVIWEVTLALQTLKQTVALRLLRPGKKTKKKTGAYKKAQLLSPLKT